MSNKKLTVALVVVAIIAISGFFVKAQVQTPFGIAAGPSKTDAQEFLGGVAVGLVNSTSTTDTSYTMVAADLANIRQGAFYDTYIHMKTGSVATTTDTFPATSTLAFVLPKPGMRANVCFENATTTGGAGLVLAEGTGWNFVVASSTRTQTSSGLAPASTISRTAMGSQPLCGEIIRERNIINSAGFVDSTSTRPGDLTFILTPTYPAQ